MTTGQQLKRDGQDAALAAATVPHHDHGSIVADALDRTIATGDYFTADDVREKLPKATAGWLETHGNVLAALIAARARTGHSTAHGWQQTTRARRKTNPNRIWKGTHK